MHYKAFLRILIGIHVSDDIRYLQNKNPLFCGIFYGRGDEIRTHDLFVPNEALYQAEPHPDTLLHIISNREKVESEN
jgi:hypothetical protein